MTTTSNAVRLSACIAQVEALRFTPAGLPALSLQLDHESVVQEAGSERQVNVTVKAVAFGTVAERLAAQAVGSHWKFSGFLAAPRIGKHPVLHIQQFEQD